MSTPRGPGTHPRLLIVAGHDSSHAAGLDADRASVRRSPVDATFLATAYTEQDASGVRTVGARPADDWLREARLAIVERIGALKFGLLPGAEHVAAAQALVDELRARHGRDLPIVLDPVLAASSGTRFLDEHATATLRATLAAHDVILTPNLDEAAELGGVSATELAASLPARVAVAVVLLARGARAVVLKGGHGAEQPVHDLVATRDGGVRWLRHRRTVGGKLRGSGCRFATRLAAELALGRSLEDAAAIAGRHVARAIAAAPPARTRHV